VVLLLDYFVYNISMNSINKFVFIMGAVFSVR